MTAADSDAVEPAGSALSYASAGVDVQAGHRAVELMTESVQRTRRPEVIGGLGGFAGLFQPDLSGYRHPVLATSTDGVGTKLVLAQQLGRHDTVGIDLVAMVLDDLVVVGAEPLFMTDYIAIGRLDPNLIATIVAGIAEGCVQAGCALVGGETAEHPGVLAAGEYDLSGSGVGIVDRDRLLSADNVRPGDVLIAMASAGLHSNGYSLVREILRVSGVQLSSRPAELPGASLGEHLLTPTRIYTRACLALRDEVGVVAFSHITGGGLAANLARVLPPQVDAVIDRSTWTVPAIFRYLARAGNVSAQECELAFNQGVGMVAIVRPEKAADALGVLSARDIPAWVLGAVTTGSGQALMRGSGPTGP